MAFDENLAVVAEASRCEGAPEQETVLGAPAPDALVLLDIDEGVATLTLNRPAQHNALNQVLAEALLAALEELDHRDGVRCVLLRAAGRSFGVGGDLSTFADASLSDDRARRLLTTLSAAVLRIHRSDKLFVSAAQGAVAGGSLSLALCCDYWLWGHDATLTPAYSRLAATPDCGLTWTLSRALGPQRALQWLLDGTAWSANRAMVEGLGYGVAPAGSLDAAARELAERVARVSPQAVRGTKRLLDGVQARDLAAQLEHETTEFLACAGSDEFRQRVEAFKGNARRS